MRVLHVVDSLNQQSGGPLRAVLDISAGGIPLGLDAEVIGFTPLAVPDNPFPPHRIHEMPIARPKSYRYSPKLADWIDQNLQRFDGVILHGMWLYPNWAFSRACRKKGIPYICFPHGMLGLWALYKNGAFKAVKKTVYWYLREKSVFRHAAAVFFTTERERQRAQQTFRLPPTSFVVIPYGIQRTGTQASEPVRTDLKFAPNRKVALFLGRLHPKKNAKFLIEAWAKAKMHPDWLLVIAGQATPAYRRLLISVIARHGLQNQVQCVGPVAGQDKSYLLGRATWFLLPSEHENFGVAVLESVNAGCPVAISDQVYLSDYFHPKAEILPIRLDAWIDFMKSRMQDEAHRQSVIELDRKYVLPKFSIDVVTQNWTATITETFAAGKETPLCSFSA